MLIPGDVLPTSEGVRIKPTRLSMASSQEEWIPTGRSISRNSGTRFRTWLDKGGYFHTDNMHVIEKLSREGDTLHYQVTVDDPGVLLQPWVMSPRVLKLNTNPKAFIREGDPCRDVDYENMVSKIRH